MDKQTADIILQLLTALTNWSHDHWMKLHAMERVLEQHPQMKMQYQQEMMRVRQSPAAQTNFQSSEAALNNLRAKLLRD